MTRPVLHAVAAIALLSFMDALIKGLVVRLPVAEIAFLRYAVGAGAMTILCLAFRPGWPSVETLRANLGRALVVVVTAMTFFYALGQLPLAETLVLSFISPAVTAALGAILLGERVGLRTIAALAAGFAGVAVIVAGGIGEGAGSGARETSLLGVAAVLVAAVGYSASNVLLRARAQRDPILTIVAIQNVAPGAILAGPAAWSWVAPTTGEWGLLAAVGLLGVGGHLLLARAYARAEAGILAPLDYTALVWAVLIGFAFFAEVPDLPVAIGAALILGAAWLAGRGSPTPVPAADIPAPVLRERA